MELNEYVRKLGGSEDLYKKIEEIKTLATERCPEKIEDFFISEYRRKNGSRLIENLWFFSPKYVMESKKIIDKSYNLDIMCIDEYIDRYEVDYLNYDLKNATEESSLTIIVHLENAVLVYKASDFNCDKLWVIFNKYLKPNLYKGR